MANTAESTVWHKSVRGWEILSKKAYSGETTSRDFAGSQPSSWRLRLIWLSSRGRSRVELEIRGEPHVSILRYLLSRRRLSSFRKHARACLYTM